MSGGCIRRMGSMNPVFLDFGPFQLQPPKRCGAHLQLVGFTVFKKDNGEPRSNFPRNSVFYAQETNFNFETSLNGRPSDIFGRKDFSGKPSDNF